MFYSWTLLTLLHQVNESSKYRCTYWNFSEPWVLSEYPQNVLFTKPDLHMSCCLHSVGSGSWVTDGITTTDNMTFGYITSVQCQSTHLTSFAVLVDVAGGLQVCSECHNVWQNVAMVNLDNTITTLLCDNVLFGRAYQKQSARPCR